MLKEEISGMKKTAKEAAETAKPERLPGSTFIK